MEQQTEQTQEIKQLPELRFGMEYHSDGTIEEATVLPFGNSCLKEAQSSFQVHKVNNLVHYMEEVWRVLEMGGTVAIIAPYYASVKAHQDLDTRRMITELLWHNFNSAARKQMGIEKEMNCNFEIVSINYAMNEEWKSKSQDAITQALRYYWNVANDIVVILKKVELVAG
jgi:hypothetical protein